MIWQLLEGEDVVPKYLANGCPKHGLHLLSGLIHGFVSPVPKSIYNTNHWIGTFQFNSFAPVWQEMDRWFFLMSRLRQGYYYQGHIGYRDDVSEFIRLSRIAHCFIYRDLRDVAVSHAHHVASSDNTKYRHGGKSIYHAMGDFDDILSAVITGIGPYLGVIDLFELYTPWLAQDWILPLKFEDILSDMEDTAKSIIDYGIRKITQGIWESKYLVDHATYTNIVESMVQLASNKEASPTFRKGLIGEWETTFKPHHKELFKSVDKKGWLVKLGYERDNSW